MQSKHDDGLSDKTTQFATTMAAFLLGMGMKRNFKIEINNINTDEFAYLIRLSKLIIEQDIEAIANCLMELPSTSDFPQATIESIQMNMKQVIEQWLQLAGDEVMPDAFLLAASAGITSLVDFFLKEKHVNPAINECIAVVGAAFGNHLDVLELLIKDGRISDPKFLEAVALSENDNVFNEIAWLMASRKGIYNPYVNEVLTLLSNDGRDDTVQYINGQLTHEKTEAAKKSMTFFSGNHLAAFPRELRQILQNEYASVVYQNASL